MPSLKLQPGREGDLPSPEGEQMPLVRASDAMLKSVGVDPDELHRKELELLARAPGDPVVREYISEFHALARRAAELTGVDSLTGAYNRRRYEAELAKLQQECERLPTSPESPHRRKTDMPGVERRRAKF
ncbi:MAG: hypothetical protein AAB606_00905, partial [Patescibacteria group bacterium]